MSSYIYFSRVAFGLLAIVSPVMHAYGEELDLKMLAAKLPVLSAKSKDLGSFMISGRVQLNRALAVRFDVAWAAPNETAALMTVDGDQPTPVMFASQGKVLVVDYVRGAAALRDKSAPLLTGAVTDSGKFNFGLGVSGKPKVEVDLSSFLHGLGNQPEWTRQADGQWQCRSASKSGDTHIISDFDVKHPFPLRKLQLFVEDAPQPSLAIDRVTINEPFPKHWKSFPARTEFPNDLVVEQKTFTDDQQMQELAEVMKQFFNCLLATGGIDRRELRDGVEAFGKVDWKQAAANRRKYAPQILKMLGPRE